MKHRRCVSRGRSTWPFGHAQHTGNARHQPLSPKGRALSKSATFTGACMGAQSPYPAVTAAALAATAAVLFLHVRRRRAVVQQVELVQLNLRELPKDAVPAELRVETYVDLDKAARYRPASHTSPLAHTKFGSRTRAVVAMSTSTTCAPRLTSLRCLMASMPTQWTTCSERSASATPEPRC
jgi:hypothetical protein